ncbi:hypothetical protein IFM89_032518 [Coptis chinensis]|uniref:H(+)-exporting diphosphatase n=1 Tax=Coptis chinensis TaxID=261450 RepID=A0A835ISK5_9MAGN|nr:hypothetical protein IFM89_032518 [Coptis chinensis]
MIIQAQVSRKKGRRIFWMIHGFLRTIFAPSLQCFGRDWFLETFNEVVKLYIRSNQWESALKVIADNVGDITRMGPNLFGSYVEASYATLVVASIFSYGFNHQFTVMMYPLLISSMDVVDSCRTGAATNVILGLALGYKSVIIPIFTIADVVGKSHLIRERTDTLDALWNHYRLAAHGFFGTL